VARAQPGVAGGRLYVGSQSGAVYSLNASSGCIYWTFEAEAAVRSSIVIGTLGSANRAAVYFGDQKANVYAVDAASGKLVWKSHVEEHFAAMITGSPRCTETCCTCRFPRTKKRLLPLPPMNAAHSVAAWSRWKPHRETDLETYTIDHRPELTKRGALRQFVEWLKSGPQMYGPSGAAVWSTPTIDEKTGALYIATATTNTDPQPPPATR